MARLGTLQYHIGLCGFGTGRKLCVAVSLEGCILLGVPCHRMRQMRGPRVTSGCCVAD